MGGAPGVRIVVPDLRSVGPGEERSSLQGSSFAAVGGFPHGGTMLDQLFMGAVENLQWRVFVREWSSEWLGPMDVKIVVPISN